MHLEFYGVRGGFPTSEQMVSLLVSVKHGRFLLDAGSSSVFKDEDHIASISTVLITHDHHDHVAMLPHLVLARLYKIENTTQDSGHCLIVAPQTVSEIMQSMGLEQGDSYHHTYRAPQSILGIEVETEVTHHSKKNYAYRFQLDGRSMVYTGDTSYYPGLADFCSEVDLLVCEATCAESSLEKASYWGHMTPSMVAQLVTEARPKATILTHFSELTGDVFVENTRKYLNESINIRPAFEGLEIHLG